MPHLPAECPTILVVDDDVANLRTFQRVFRNKLRIVTAASGAEALDALRKQQVDLAFVDYTMPRMDGGELLGILREQHPSIVRFLLTGSSDLEAINQIRGTGLAFAILSKPWSRAMIDDAVSAATGERNGCGR